MYSDYHIHSTFSPDGKSTMEEMILRAIDLNLKEICFTDHVDYDIKYMNHFVVDYKKYFDSLNYYIEKYKDKIKYELLKPPWNKYYQ
ncbi:PHP domain-containing protein [Intestinibacter sp.]